MFNRTNLLLLTLLLTTNASAITLDEFTERLVETHPYFVQLSLSESQNIVNQKSLSTYTDWKINAGANQSYTGGKDISSRLYDNLYSTGYEIGATRKLDSSGATINIAHSLTRNDKDSKANHLNLFSVDYSRPLLQNKDGLNDRLNLDIATINIMASKVSLEEQAENFLARQLSKFIDLALKQEIVQIHKVALNLAKEQLDLTEDKFNNSLVDITALIQEKDNYVKAKQQSLQTNKELIIERRELANLIGAKESDMIIEMNLFKEQKLNIINPIDIVKNSRAIQKYDFDKAIQQRELESNENKTMPNVDLNLGLSSLGEDDKVFGSFGNRDFSWNVGVNISYPLGSRKELLAVENTEIKMSDIDAKKAEAEMNNVQQINYLLAQVDLLSELVELYLEQGALAEEKVIEEQKKFSEARGQKSLVLAARINANQAKMSYLQAAGTYQKIIIDYKAAIDQLYN